MYDSERVPQIMTDAFRVTFNFLQDNPEAAHAAGLCIFLIGGISTIRAGINLYRTTFKY